MTRIGRLAHHEYRMQARTYPRCLQRWSRVSRKTGTSNQKVSQFFVRLPLLSWHEGEGKGTLSTTCNQTANFGVERFSHSLFITATQASALQSQGAMAPTLYREEKRDVGIKSLVLCLNAISHIQVRRHGACG